MKYLTSFGDSFMQIRVRYCWHFC